MKKRLLITSIVMMLVVAVALSTATYAWFTQNASVTANSITMTAATADAQSISIGWFGSETKGTTLSASNSSPLQPMCPTTNMASTNANTVAFTGAYVDVTGKFASAGSEKTPYTWNNGTATAFYINNDSNSQPVSISVAVNSITNGADPVALADNTLLEGGGKVYYRKSDSTYTKLVAGTDYTPNVSKVTDEAASTGDNINTGLASGTIYSTKGIQDYVRIAIFATTTQSSPLTGTVAPADYTYKGLLAKTAGNNTVYGTITSGDTAASMTTMSSTDSVVVINNLPALNRVYVIAMVWLDGADFTQHENALTANVSLTFSAGTAS